MSWHPKLTLCRWTFHLNLSLREGTVREVSGFRHVCREAAPSLVAMLKLNMWNKSITARFRNSKTCSLTADSLKSPFSLIWEGSKTTARRFNKALDDKDNEFRVLIKPVTRTSKMTKWNGWSHFSWCVILTVCIWEAWPSLDKRICLSYQIKGSVHESS